MNTRYIVVQLCWFRQLCSCCVGAPTPVLAVQKLVENQAASLLALAEQEKQLMVALEAGCSGASN